MRHAHHLFILLILLVASQTFAQSKTPAVFREDLVVTASAIPEDVESVPASVTVISRETIERHHAVDLEEVLREVPGLTLSRAGSAGRQTSLFVRGVNSAQTLVLWNGIEINNPYFSGYDWGQFSTVGVEKVEVVRGPFSSLYGADAMGGVINVVTGANQPGWNADLQVGENGLLNGRAEITRLWENTQADLAVESRDDDGFHPNDDFSQLAVLTSANWNLTERVVVGASGRFNDYELGIPFDQGQPAPGRRQDGSELQIALPVTAEIGSSVWSLTLSRTEHEINFDDPLSPFGAFASETDSRINRVAASGRFDTPLGTIVAGGETESSRVDDVSVYGTSLDGSKRDARSLFVEDRISESVAGGDLEVSAGLRYDEFDQFGSETSPRLSLSWGRERLRARVGYGEAFRAPSIGDLYYPFYGNPDLRSETSRSWEAGLDWTSGTTSLVATWFHNDIEGLIVFDPSTNRAENIGEARTSGVELGGSAQLGPLRINGTWTVLDTEDRATGLELLRRPSNSGSLSAYWEHQAFAALVSAIHMGDRDDVEAAFPFGRVPNDSYTVVDLDLRYELSFGLMPYLRIENMLDERYQEVLGFPAPTRRAIIGLRYSH